MTIETTTETPLPPTKTEVRAAQTGSDIKATSDTDGSYLIGGAGDDILRGGRFDDILLGGRGDDQMFGGGGADVFRFFGSEIGQVGETTDTDKIRDLDFSTGDTIHFVSMGTDALSDVKGLDARADGTGGYVSSWAGLVAFVDQLDDVYGATATQRGTTDTLVISYTIGGATQQIEITGGWDDYLLALNGPQPA